MKIQIATPLALHELGRRANQEDALWPPRGEATAADRLFIVCDGMGGHEHGEVASQTVTQTIGTYVAQRLSSDDVLTDDVLMDAISEAYNQLDARDNPDSQRKMGTTLTLVCLHRGGCTMAHIGDSRIYHLRPAERRVLYQSRDHSLVMDLYLSGELTREQMGTYKGKNVITRAMQPALERRFKADIVHTNDIQAGDLFLLCSDGITEKLTDDRLLDILCSDVPDDSRLQQLREATSAATDNHTAYLIRIQAVELEATDAEAPNDAASSRANLINIMRICEAENDVEAEKKSASNRKPSLFDRIRSFLK